jgi:hypothetical protein
MTEVLSSSFNTAAIIKAIDHNPNAELRAVPIKVGPALNSVLVRPVDEFPSPGSKTLDEAGRPFALRYPGERPEFSYAIFNNEVAAGTFADRPEDLSAGKSKDTVPSYFVNVRHAGGHEYVFDIDDLLEEAGAAQMHERYPVVAFGSNANPGQLAQKFNGLKGADRDVIPNSKAWVKGVVPVYVGRIGINGYVFTDFYPASDPDIRTEVYINFLSNAQLEALDTTEKAYSLCEIPGVYIEVAGDTELTMPAYLYAGRDDDKGASLLADSQGRPIRLAELNTEGDMIDNEFGAMTQQEVLQYIHKIVGEKIAGLLCLDEVPQDELEIISLIINRQDDPRMAKFRAKNSQSAQKLKLGNAIGNATKEAIKSAGRLIEGKNIKSRLPADSKDIGVRNAKTLGQLISTLD